MGGISGILSFLALLGFLGFILGVALIAASASQGRPIRGGIVLAGVGLVVGAILSVVSQGILIVQPQEVAVIFNTLSGQLESPRGPGTHVIIPIVQTVTIYPTRVETYTQEIGASDSQGPVSARTIDGQEVLIEVSVLYRVDAEEVNKVHRNWQDRYTEGLLIPVLRGYVRDVVSAFRAEAVYSSSREEVQRSIEGRLRERLETEGLVLNDFIIRDVSFSNEEFAQSIERVQIAERRALEAAQQADLARTQARGERDAEVIRAEGEGQAIVLRAQAQAEALSIISAQIAANPLLLQYEYIQNLSDNVNIALVPSNSPFLFDFDSLGSPNPDFVAPEVPEVTITVTPVPQEESSTGDN